ncbi:hypothetical protein AB0H92_35275, partial [Streptomyces phaeochromogenes]|uniref:hypothetical protein n=1 Tax=Streptomyces phaeochromogenes TaxID=1923 RepID=UPI00348EA59A
MRSGQLASAAAEADVDGAETEAGSSDADGAAVGAAPAGGALAGVLPAGPEVVREAAARTGADLDPQPYPSLG